MATDSGNLWTIAPQETAARAPAEETWGTRSPSHRRNYGCIPPPAAASPPPSWAWGCCLRRRPGDDAPPRRRRDRSDIRAGRCMPARTRSPTCRPGRWAGHAVLQPPEESRTRRFRAADRRSRAMRAPAGGRGRRKKQTQSRLRWSGNRLPGGLSFCRCPLEMTCHYTPVWYRQGTLTETD